MTILLLTGSRSILSRSTRLLQLGRYCRKLHVLDLPLATSGQSHMLALDYALRPVLGALGARHVLRSIYATDARMEWTAEQGWALDPAIERRIAGDVGQLSADLHALKASSSVGSVPVPFSRVRCSV